MSDRTRTDGGRLRCLLADDHPALLAAVSDLLEREDFEVVGPAGDGGRAVALTIEKRPDLALVDYRMPGLAGTELIAALKKAHPPIRVAVYTADADALLVVEALAAGAQAVLLKEAPLGEVGRALDAIASGRQYVDATLAGGALRSGRRGTALTDRERDVLRLLADGLSHDEIGSRLSIGGETVRTHVRKACERLGAATRTQAVATALRRGLIA